MRPTRNYFTHDDIEMVDYVNSLPKEDYYFVSDGRIFYDLEAIEVGKLIALNFRMLGGKGGFGSLLRSFRGTYGDWPLQEKGLMEGRELMEGNWDRRLPDTCQSNSKLKGDGIASDSLPNNK